VNVPRLGCAVNCTHPVTKVYERKNRDWEPPMVEKHVKCLACGWQSPWKKDE
jgi:hypothetical protein